MRPSWLLVSATCAIGSATYSAAVVTASHQGEQLQALGMVANFSTMPQANDSFSTWVPRGASAFGCGGDDRPAVNGSFVAIVARGNCTFLEKAVWAKEVGAAGVVIVSDSEQAPMMSGNPGRDLGKIFAVSVSKSFGSTLDGQALQFGEYKPKIWDLSEGLLICLATLLVVLGAIFSVADIRQGSPVAALASPEDEVVEMSNIMALGFCVLGSCMLVIMFFLMKYLIYVIIFAFCVGGVSCLTQIGSRLLQHAMPNLKQSRDLAVLGPVALSDIVAAVPSVVVVTSWLILRNAPAGWIFQDIIGAGFLCMIQRTLRLPNMRVAALLLSIMFFFDVFWVFVSPLFFGSSVMVGVATGGGTGETVPMLLRIPAIGDAFGRDRMLGFGDVALPGLLISYLLRFDTLNKKTLRAGYFLPSVVGYFCGLVLTVIALMVMQMGQPALLYLVPCTLGTTLVLGARRGELAMLLEAPGARSQSLSHSQELNAAVSH